MDRIRVRVDTNTVDLNPADVPYMEHGTATEHLIYLTVPSAGNDALLIGVVESQRAATELAGFLQFLVGLYHDRVDGKTNIGVGE